MALGRKGRKKIIEKSFRGVASERFGDFDGKELAGAEGFEPSPSTLTVWCPTGWTTPQQRAATASIADGNKLGSAAMRGEGFT
jgi:hypothetical protein